MQCLMLGLRGVYVGLYHRLHICDEGCVDLGEDVAEEKTLRIAHLVHVEIVTKNSCGTRESASARTMFPKREPHAAQRPRGQRGTCCLV